MQVLYSLPHLGLILHFPVLTAHWSHLENFQHSDPNVLATSQEALA